ncbi:flagellar biosynthesis protein FlhB [Novosphingobium profundi]|uniref:flagellar biosynthesis protein FlhB n=1 Tax=Novosphingobium profundi TaxID=1774954 RepID=UPI001BD99AD3|nr:flagellar biosynthesis protein FlhB [Novosphingobium profundi]MBT0670539.1 flagellar biosynthesis protein FlhB [Novosphingobium profundi]
MADTDSDQKTEEPTDKRLEDARKRGDVAMAAEVRHGTMMLGVLVVTGWLGASACSAFLTLFTRLWGGADGYPMTTDTAQGMIAGVMLAWAMALWPVLALLMLCAIGTGLLQGRPTLSWSRISPRWSKLNPFAGLKRLFGMRALVEFAKTLAKFSAIGLAVFLVLRPRLSGLDQIVGYTPAAVGSAAVTLAFEAVRAVVFVVLTLVIFDFVYQRRAFMKRMRMTLQEIKDEYKQSEGDPKIKARIRQIRMERARRRMMAAVPTASVIVTNPTHYSVALRYEHGTMAAPVVVAKGVDAIAMRIREIATEANVPIVESPPLARALYASVDIDRPIPVEHYAAVAEIIGYVMRLSKRRKT